MSFPLMPVVSPSAGGGGWEVISSGTVGTDTLRYNAVSASGTWAVAGGNGKVYRSSNYGSTWLSSTPSSGQMWGMAFGNGLFAVAQDSGNDLLTSSDGASWTTQISGEDRDHHQVKYNDGYFVLGSGVGGGDGYIYASADGINWVFGPQGAVGPNSVWCGIYDSTFAQTFAGGLQYKYNREVPTAVSAWRATAVSGPVGLIYDIAVKPASARAVIAANNGIYLAIGVLYSWTSAYSSSAMYGVAWCGDRFIAVGAGGKIISSPDGTTWTEEVSNTSNDLYGISSYNGVHIATGNNGTILRSSGV